MNYEESLNFALKEYKTTWDTYHLYKPKKWKQIRETYSGDINLFLNTLPRYIKYEFGGLGRYKSMYYDMNSKGDIKQLKNNVNYVTMELEIEFLKRILKRTNKNECTSFAVRLYLDHYKRINRIMKDTFLEIVEERRQTCC